MCIVMAAAASSLETVVTHFTLAPRREDYSKRKAMGSYYNHLASISALSAALAVGIVYAVWP
ncbi:hypothetical protein APY03_0489 [Variovorax sp. WDL1]|nr:hypothetical protein APY03_0489 [Variovorax sp. WDL1]